MTDSYVRAPGAIALLSAKESIPIGALPGLIEARLPALRVAFGPDVEVRISTRYEIDPLAEIYGERTMGVADAILDAVTPSGGTALALAERMDALSALADLLDRERSAIGVGELIYIHRDLPEGGEMLNFLGRRDPAVSKDEMSRWWLVDHTSLIRRLQNGMKPAWTYAQLHVDHAASKTASARAGLPWTEYDMGDLIAIEDRKQFLDFHCQPHVGEALAQDEQGHLDQSSWRGGLVKVVGA